MAFVPQVQYLLALWTIYLQSNFKMSISVSKHYFVQRVAELF